MRWRRTGNTGIEDRRGMGVGMPAIGGGLGIIGLLLALLLGGGLPDLGGSGGTQGSTPQAGQDTVTDFVGFVVDDVQGFWRQRLGGRYQDTKLVLFTQATQTGCGMGSAQTGPFYCPVDSKVYLDESFFQELRDRFGAPGDFAQAYVIAHEFGHHVQNLVGTSDQVHAAQQRNPSQANELSVRLELQADCLAGVWGWSAEQDGILEAGDVDEGLAAAASVGDDRIQSQAGMDVDPETWTHGSSEQRTRWFRRGFDSGNPDACDTFAAG